MAASWMCRLQSAGIFNMSRLPIFIPLSWSRWRAATFKLIFRGGKAAPDWQRLLTEIQILLHGSEVNAARQAQGELPVNSLWFWGAGELPAAFDTRWSLIYSDDVFVQGLAMLADTPCLPLPDDMQTLCSGDAVNPQVLVVIHARSTCEMAASYQALEAACFAPLLKKMRAGTIEKLNILTEEKGFALQRADLYKFWCRKKSIDQYFPV